MEMASLLEGIFPSMDYFYERQRGNSLLLLPRRKSTHTSESHVSSYFPEHDIYEGPDGASVRPSSGLRRASVGPPRGLVSLPSIVFCRTDIIDSFDATSSSSFPREEEKCARAKLNLPWVKCAEALAIWKTTAKPFTRENILFSLLFWGVRVGLVGKRRAFHTFSHNFCA